MANKTKNSFIAQLWRGCRSRGTRSTGRHLVNPLWCHQIPAGELCRRASLTMEHVCLPANSEKKKHTNGYSTAKYLVEIFMSLTELRAPGPTAMTVPSRTFAWAFSGMTIPPLVWVNASARFTKMRSNNGMRRLATPAYNESVQKSHCCLLQWDKVFYSKFWHNLNSNIEPNFEKCSLLLVPRMNCANVSHSRSIARTW